MPCYFHDKTKGIFFSVPLEDGVILWQSYLDTCGDSRMLNPINMIRNAVRATRSLGPSSKARRTTCSVKPLGAILLALLMTLSSPVGAQDFQKGFAAAQVGDFATALQEWTPLAEAGDASVQFNLGIMYDNGQGVPQDYAEAVKWYRLAADQGNADAQYNLGIRYDNGQGVPQDYAEAVKWYRLAADQGNASAQFNLGFMYNKGEGVPQDYAEAVKWFRLAAEQGNAKAQNRLAMIYEEGEGVLQNYKEAVKWYMLAAEQEDSYGQYRLAKMYEEGMGVLQDNAIAHMWYNIVSANGAGYGGVSRDKIAKTMTPAEIEKAQAMARECMSSGYTKCGY